VKKLDFIYFDAGGGHRAAATALREVCQRQQQPFEIRMVNLQELLDSLDVFRKVTRVRLQDLYNLMLKKGWTLGSTGLMRGMQFVIRRFHRRQVRMLEEFWRKSQPDLVVSIVPHFNRALCESVAQVQPRTPFVTVITDIADYPPHFWMERQTQHLICGSDRAMEQAMALGYAPERVHRASGMILSPRFYDIEPLTDDARARARAGLGFDSEQPVGLVLFGGQG
jgi:1,2-diacylglycerol 3-beta-galactosyltransferase